MSWVQGEDALEEVIALGGDRQDAGEEIVVFEVRSEGLVGRMGLLPRISAACEVDENDAERPDVVLKGGIRLVALEETALALYRKGKQVQ